MENWQQEKQTMSYGELVKMRDALLEDIREYELYKSKGSHLTAEFYEVPDTPQGYQEKLTLLAGLVHQMAELYTDETLVVDETEPASMLRFAEGVFWGDGTQEPHPSDALNAFSYLTRLAQNNNADAANLLGALYSEGRYVEKNAAEGTQWYIKAAELGSSLAMSNAGYCFYYGSGVAQNYETAFQYFVKAMLLGEYDAFNKVGDMYREGLYVAEDKQTAFKIYMNGHNAIPQEVLVDAYPVNLLRLGECFLYGYGCTVNRQTAEKLLRDAKEVLELQLAYGRSYAGASLKKTNELLTLMESTAESCTIE